MRKPGILNRAATLVLAAVAVAFATPVLAQDTTIVVDGNIFWDNDNGSYSTDSGGATCAVGAYTVTQLATVFFTNQTIDPMLNPDIYNINAPRWNPLEGSPAISGNANSRVLRASDVDPWFQDVCYTGAVPYTGGDDAKDWTVGWTYYNYDGGLGRTDIDTTKTVVMVSSDVNANTTWTNTNNYVITGRIGVNPPAILTIEPGTVVMGSGVGSYLVIERGAQIDAQGTKAQPIIFTSGARWQDGAQAVGDWGGVVIHGRATANCVGGCGLTTGGDCQSEGGAGYFGGTDDEDDSGIITYARVEYAGQEISPNNELNSWTMNAVGRGTTLEYMQAHLGLDDSFEWFGGTVRIRHIVATGGDDDNIDWQMGFRGRVQFACVQQANTDITANADHGIEADNNEFNYDCPHRSAPALSNLTMIGTGAQLGGTQGILLRRGTAATIINSIVQGFSDVGLRMQHEETFANCPGVAPSEYACAVLAVGDEVGAQRDMLVRAAPNPTAGPANITFTLPRDERVTVKVFDVAGRLVESVLDRQLPSGEHTIRWDAAGVPTGLYFYTVSAPSGSAKGKLVVAH